MLPELFSNVGEIKYGMINSFADSDEDFITDCEFLDDGIIESEVERLKEELTNNKSLEKYRKIAFLLSNKENRIEEAKQYSLLSEDIELIEFIDTLHCYFDGENDDFIARFHTYEMSVEGIENHFLFHKVYASELVKSKKYNKAIPYLRRALQIFPDDIGCYYSLRDCFEETGRVGEAQIVRQIIKLLSAFAEEALEDYDET